MIMIFLWLKICGNLNENGLLPLKQTISHEKLMVGRLLSLGDAAISRNKLALSVGTKKYIKNMSMVVHD